MELNPKNAETTDMTITAEEQVYTQSPLTTNVFVKDNERIQ